MSALEHFAVLAILVIALAVGAEVAQWLGGTLPALAYVVTLVLGYAVCVWGIHPFNSS